uniref:RNA-directed DNA polymerase, eukaryota n=1 Tax=Tanacetum cinerariifolium TaxID=118510 RepID=A0A699GV96_TANCI|nr:RNA-directed DNA polymerase, eukaryota [Tanacetum cinerariifolium]
MVLVHLVHARLASTEQSPFHSSTWNAIIRKVNVLKNQGVDLISHCKIRVGSGMRTCFWRDIWLGVTQLSFLFSRIYALENNKDSTVAEKMQGSITFSFRRPVRGGAEAQQLDHLHNLIGSTTLSNLEDRWVWDMNGEGVFRVKDVRNLLDEYFLPKEPAATRWIKSIPIKINVFACCGLAIDVTRLICRWWNLAWMPFEINCFLRPNILGEKFCLTILLLVRFLGVLLDVKARLVGIAGSRILI